MRCLLISRTIGVVRLVPPTGAQLGSAWLKPKGDTKDVARGAGSFRVPSRFPCARMLMDASRLRRQVKLAYHITRGLWQ